MSETLNASKSSKAELRDRFRDRFQIEFGVNFYLMPNDTVDSSWRRHLLDPWFKLVRIGDELRNPRSQLPKFGKGFVDSEITKADPPGSAPATYRWWSRCFWLCLGVRLFGLEAGLGVFYRKPFSGDPPE